MSHITRLQAENIKKLRVLDIRPGTSAGVVPIRGRNAQGKSSTLDAIQMALGGSKFTPSRPVRAGEDEGAIRLELDTGEVILRRFTSEGGDTLEVTNGEGYKAGSPQALLNKLFASVAFDPLAFTRLKPAEQLNTLRGLVKLDVDVDALTAANQGDYDARREKNRELAKESQKLEQLPTFPDLANATKMDEADLEQTIATAAETNGALERRRVGRETFLAALAADRDRLQEDRDRIAALVRLADELETSITERQAQVDGAEPLPAAVDITQAQTDLREARERNRRIDANAAATAQKQLVDLLQREADDLTDAMEQRKAKIAEAIGRAEMPVPGLGFGDGEVLFGGVPLEQASSAEQLRVSTAIGIASSPKLRVMLVRDGSLLDDDGQRILAELAAAHDFQLWVEAVDTSGTVGIVLEDGSVASIDGEPAPEPEAIGKPKRRAKKPEDQEKAEAFADVAVAATGTGVMTDDEVAADMQRVVDTDERTPPEVEKVPTRAREDGSRRSVLQHPAAGNSLFD